MVKDRVQGVHSTLKKGTRRIIVGKIILKNALRDLSTITLLIILLSIKTPRMMRESQKEKERIEVFWRFSFFSTVNKHRVYHKHYEVPKISQRLVLRH